MGLVILCMGLLFVLGMYGIWEGSKKFAKEKQAYFDSLPVLTGKIRVFQSSISPFSGDTAAWYFWVWDYDREGSNGLGTSPDDAWQVHFPSAGLRLEIEGETYAIAVKRSYFKMADPRIGPSTSYTSFRGLHDSLMRHVRGYDRRLNGVVSTMLENPTGGTSGIAQFRLREYSFVEGQEVSLYATIINDTVRLYP